MKGYGLSGKTGMPSIFHTFGQPVWIRANGFEVEKAPISNTISDIGERGDNRREGLSLVKA
jgi:hypothetical protein